MDEEDEDEQKWLADSRVSSALIAYGKKIKSWGIAIYYQDQELLSDPKIQLAAVNYDGWAIEFIENPSEEAQLAAVSQYGNAIQYIENPSEEIQLVAVRVNIKAIKYIKNPSEKVQLAATKQIPWDKISTEDRTRFLRTGTFK